MKNMTLQNIAAACHGTLVCDRALTDKEVQGVVIDSRKAGKDYLFIATKGERVDGHQFINQVFEQGALCAICERVPAVEVKAYILVEDSFIALQEIAEYYRNTLAIKIVGITGSVGKTSTKEFIASVLEQKIKILKTIGNYNNEVGVPLTLLQIREEHEAAVLEMGINHFGEMHRLSKMVRPDICVITNIGECHLEFLGSRKGILAAKSEMFDYIQEDGTVCINGDDDMLRTILEVRGKIPLHYGLTKESQVYASDIVNHGLFGSSCTIHIGGRTFRAKIPLSGEHMIYNALAAAAVGQLFGLSDRETADGIAAIKALDGRNHIIKTDMYVIIDDCYNANPVSMKAAVDILMTALTRKVAIIGDMGELGDNSRKLHEEVGRYCMESGVDLLICVGEAAQSIAQGAAAAAKTIRDTKVIYFADKEQMMEALLELLNEGDTILVKASHFMGFDTIVQYLREILPK